MTPGESTDSVRVAAVLGEHRHDVEERVNTEDPALRDYGGVCTCGRWNAFDNGGYHLAHVAAALIEAGVGFVAQAKAEALREAADERWDTAVDWLLNQVDANDFIAPFWAFYDGVITEAELRSEAVSIDEINRRRLLAESEATA